MIVTHLAVRVQNLIQWPETCLHMILLHKRMSALSGDKMPTVFLQLVVLARSGKKLPTMAFGQQNQAVKMLADSCLQYLEAMEADYNPF